MNDYLRLDFCNWTFYLIYYDFQHRIVVSFPTLPTQVMRKVAKEQFIIAENHPKIIVRTLEMLMVDIHGTKNVANGRMKNVLQKV